MSSLFKPLQLAGVHLQNRIVMPPMSTRLAARDGCARDVHCFHYASRALGGTALVLLEATGVENRGRCHPANLGLWNEAQAASLEDVGHAIHRAGARAGIQLQHGGRKAYPDYGPVAPSPLPFSAAHPTPRALDKGEMERIAESFAQAARRAWRCGFDFIELHAAHGYLLHQFLSPHSNRREDEYGGDAAGRLRFPLQVIERVKGVLPDGFPLLIRVSGTEYLRGGYSTEEMVDFCSAFGEAGIALVDVSSGGNSPHPPQSWPGYQVGPAASIRRATGLPVIAAGRLETPALAQAVVELGLADLVGIGRGLLDNPHWPLQAARELGCEDLLYAQSSYLRSWRG